MELYCFEKYRGYTIVVEPLECGDYEGIAFIHSHCNPVFTVKSDNGENAVEYLMDQIDWLLEND